MPPNGLFIVLEILQVISSVFFIIEYASSRIQSILGNIWSTFDVIFSKSPVNCCVFSKVVLIEDEDVSTLLQLLDRTTLKIQHPDGYTPLMCLVFNQKINSFQKKLIAERYLSLGGKINECN